VVPGGPELTYSRWATYLPDLVRARPYITDEHKRAGEQQPPAPSPFHCKPWVEGHSIGLAVPYGYRTLLTVWLEVTRRVRFIGLSELELETGLVNIVSARGHGRLGLMCGYRIGVSADHSILVLPPSRPISGLRLIPSLYSPAADPGRPILELELTQAELPVRLTSQTELARLVLVPQKANLEARPLDPAELAELQAAESRYLDEEQRTPSRWTAASGDEFTHLYRIWSARHRQSGE
jgi:hypothetical protein